MGGGDSKLSFSQQKGIIPLALSQLHLLHIGPGNQEIQKEKTTIQMFLRPSLVWQNVQTLVCRACDGTGFASQLCVTQIT